MRTEIKRDLVAFIGVIALVMTIIAVVFLIFVRVTVTTVIDPTPTPTVTTTQRMPDDPIVLVSIHQRQMFDLKDINTEISPLASVITSASTSVSNVPASIPDNMIDTSLTFNQPLQITPQAFGFGVITNDGTQIFTSMNNGEISVGEFKFNSNTSNFDFLTSSYVSHNTGISNSNRIVRNFLQQGQKTNQLDYNYTASAVGSSGVSSLVLSPDSLRLYVGYIDSTDSSESSFPFGQYIGKIQVWRNVQDSWSHSCSVDTASECELVSDMINPFGSQVVGLNHSTVGSTQGYNSFSETRTVGDSFAQYIKSSINSSNGNYILAVNSSICVVNGNCVNIFEEQNDFSYKAVGILFLPDTFSECARNSFGKAFSLVDDSCLVAFGPHSGTCSNVVDLPRVAYFKRDNTNQAWKFISVIDPPSATPFEFFGTSITMSQYGGVAIIGSPSSGGDQKSPVPSPGAGHVYIYVRDNRDVWVLNQTVSDPWISSTPFPNTGNFGWFVHTDKDFRLLAVTGNQDTVYRNPYPAIVPQGNECSFKNGILQKSCQYTNVIFFSIDQMTNTVAVDQNKTIRLYQEQTLQPSQRVDPLFGANVSIIIDAFRDVSGSVSSLAVIGSPLNQTVSLYNIIEQ